MGSPADWFKTNVLQPFMNKLSPDDPADKLLSLGLGSMMSKYTETEKPAVGYQGKIPKYQAVRQQVQRPDAPEPEMVNVGGTDMPSPRVRGGKGRSYFTDVKYAKKPDTDIPTVEEAREASRKQAEEIFARQNPGVENPYTVAAEPVTAATGGHLRKYAAGGIAGAHNGYYLGGKTDGMADQVPARIDGNQEARLSDGEFVIPADVVSHLGNGNSDAGAQQLHSMMDNVRTARTGNPEQGKQINPQQFMPKMAQGGLAQFAGGGNVNAVQGIGSVYKNQPYTTNFSGNDTNTSTSEDADAGNQGSSGEEVGLPLGTESSLSNWAGDYVTDMLAKGKALGDLGYNEADFAYTGDLSAGSTFLQDQANLGLMDLSNPLGGTSVTKDMGTFTPDQATLDPYMNPYTQNVIDRTAADMRRQSQIDALQDRSAMTAAGAFGGSRDALMRAERSGILSSQIGDMAAQQRVAAFNQAMDRAKGAQEMANQYGFDVLGAQARAGAEQRMIDQERIKAEYGQFREEREFPYKQVQYMQSLLQGLPLAAQTTTYSEPSAYDKLMQGEAAFQEVSDYLTVDNSTNPAPDAGSNQIGGENT